MADTFKDYIEKFSKINIANFIIFIIVLVWLIATLKLMFIKEDLHPTVKETVDNLQGFIGLILGYYLKQNVEISRSPTIIREKETLGVKYCNPTICEYGKDESVLVDRSYTDKIVDNGTER